MQNVQNAAEIQQRVINLVELYRTKVGKESQIAKDAKVFYDNWQKLNDKEIREEGEIYQYQDLGNPNEQVWIEHLMVNEQLLGHFYENVAGKNAKKDILDQLLHDTYDKAVFSEEEEAFLTSYFKEMVNYIILTPCDENLKWVNRHDGRDVLTIPSELLDFIYSRVKIAEGSRVYYPYAGFAQFANLFKGSKFLFQNKNNVWMRVALFANGIDADFFGNEIMPTSYNSIVAYLWTIDKDNKNIAHICEAYKKLPSKGNFLFLCPTPVLAEDNYSSFRKMLIDEKAIKEIIQLPDVMSKHSHSSYCLIIAEKDRDGEDIKFIDARSAHKKSCKKNYKEDFDMDAFNAIIDNEGIDGSTGLRKVALVPFSALDESILLPQIYVLERAMNSEHPVPLSSICRLVQERIRDVKFDLPLDTPYILPEDLSATFKGALDIDKLNKIGLPNNPSNMAIHDISEEDEIPFIFLNGDDISYEEQQIAVYRSSIYLDGNSDAVLWCSDGNGTRSALYHSTGKAAAVGASMFGYDLICVFYPTNGYDAISLLAVLNMPIVQRQIEAYIDYGLQKHMDDILVPTDKRIINDEIVRLKKEEEAYKIQEEELSARKTEYINEVRMRKHDMGQYIFELVNIEDLIRYYIENRETENNFCQEIISLLNNFRSSLSELSTLLDNLSKEESFGEPEVFDIDAYFKQLVNRHKADGFIIEYDKDFKSLQQYHFSKRLDGDVGINDVDYPDVELDDSHVYEDSENVIDITKINDESHPADFTLNSDESRPVTDFTPNSNESRPADFTLNSDESRPVIEERIRPYFRIPSLFIARNDFQRLTNNIIDNARKHGFTDKSRKDYKAVILLSVDTKNKRIKIDFRNNGNPLPDGMNKLRYGIKGEKAGKTAGTGIGGSYVKSFVEHYGGDYDIFMEDGWTVIRIYLPIK